MLPSLEAFEGYFLMNAPPKSRGFDVLKKLVTPSLVLKRPNLCLLRLSILAC